MFTYVTGFIAKLFYGIGIAVLTSGFVASFTTGQHEASHIVGLGTSLILAGSVINWN
ncbi:MAG: hypothetical protein KAS32_30090 [Candidatus Peribacteraceae bacterium]|nr:hypothetical protein [Candidatus Peribacteraceae bacterium]